MKLVKVLIAISVISFVTINVAVSGPPQGKGHGKSPPGWEKGEKVGWRSTMPPGLENQSRGNHSHNGKDEIIDLPPGWVKGEKEGWKGENEPPGKGRKQKNGNND